MNSKKPTLMLIALFIAILVCIVGTVLMVIHDRTCPHSPFVRDACESPTNR